MEKALIFIEVYTRLEHALICMGYAAPWGKKVDVDWDKLAKQISIKLNDPVCDGFSILITDPPGVPKFTKALSFERWQSPNEKTEVVSWNELFTKSLCVLRNNFVHGNKYYADPGYDEGRNERLFDAGISLIKFLRDHCEIFVNIDGCRVSLKDVMDDAAF